MSGPIFENGKTIIYQDSCQCAKNKCGKKNTVRGDRTRDQSIKSRTLCQAELARHVEQNPVAILQHLTFCPTTAVHSFSTLKNVDSK